ncbi:phenylacetate-CoA oxygenase subunit PaaC [Sneathiella sp. CAU 1612]|uniref:Phenylacetate-CoA oxygenase subunit PaaC n=1 Tax=Sneathiella sedimenti TaxID=2816034 RepID=A0ABS3F5U0_9PROT|nr:1,2-phenylacetyl-CoA epoxidase subunit PaaC [Sneathiella sedimenti]MBO0333744.1 phenylacetate-CoA oxygenase subunit PaaC [Sneathiella sedimenti]
MTDKDMRFDYLLRLGDNSLILGQRLAEWCGHAPMLEEDLALTNIGLDLLGQARMFLSYAGEVEGKGRDEDRLAYFRDTKDWRNLLLLEQPNGDFAKTMARQFFFDAFQYLQFEGLAKSSDDRLAGIAAKSLKEITYHRRHSADWIIRLGDGTDESHERIQGAIDDLWGYLPEMFDMDAVDDAMLADGFGVDVAALRPVWDDYVNGVLAEATLIRPADSWSVRGSREGKHSEHLGYLLAEMQFLPRAYPDAKW